MQLLVAVQVFKPQEEFSHDDRNIVLIDGARLYQIPTAAPRAEFHDDPEIRALEERAVVASDILRVQLGENSDLLDDILNLIIGALHINDLDCNWLARRFVNAIGRLDSNEAMLDLYRIGTGVTYPL